MSFATSSTAAARAAIRRRPRFTRSLATATDVPSLTGQQAQSYLSDILRLSPSSAFPPELALQILTHKSYRFVHRVAHPPPYSSAELAQAQVSHNARMGFVGRRAISAYTTMFLHSALGSDGAAQKVYEVDFLRGKDIDTKLDNLRHVNNLGRTVGDAWKVGDVMRCDRAQTGLENDFARIKGITVEAILGGVFLQHGSPAAQRVFHSQILPAFAAQLRDPALQEAAKLASESAEAIGTISQ